MKVISYFLLPITLMKVIFYYLIKVRSADDAADRVGCPTLSHSYLICEPTALYSLLPFTMII